MGKEEVATTLMPLGGGIKTKGGDVAYSAEAVPQASPRLQEKGNKKKGELLSFA